MKFALKQDVRTPDRGDGFITIIADGWIDVMIDGEQFSYRPTELTPLEPVRGQEIEVRIHANYPWQKQVFVGMYDGKPVTFDPVDSIYDRWPLWQFIPQPDQKPSAFTLKGKKAEQSVEPDGETLLPDTWYVWQDGKLIPIQADR